MATDISNGDFAYAEEYPISLEALTWSVQGLLLQMTLCPLGAGKGKEVALLKSVSWTLKPK